MPLSGNDLYIASNCGSSTLILYQPHMPALWWKNNTITVTTPKCDSKRICSSIAEINNDTISRQHVNGHHISIWLWAALLLNGSRIKETNSMRGRVIKGEIKYYCRVEIRLMDSVPDCLELWRQCAHKDGIFFWLMLGKQLYLNLKNWAPVLCS